MQVGRFIKRLINPEPEEKGEAKRDERESESGAGEESSTNFVQVEGFSDSQLGEPVSASVEPESSPDLSSNSSDEEETIPEPEQQPEPGPEPDAEPEEELQTASSLYATDSELREAGLDPDDLGEEEPEDPEQPEAPEANEESEPVSEAEPELVEAEAEQPAEEEQPEEASSATPDEPEPEPAISAPNIDEELSLARSAVESGFVVTLATELRTPISSLRVSFDLLKDPEAIRNNPVESNRLVENIERSIVRLERQASDLLEVGYIHNGNLTLAKEPLLVSEPVLAAIDISRPAATLRKVAIELEMEPDLPRAITDGLRLTQIVSHLLSNAIKFTPVGGSVVIDLPPIALPLIISDSRPVEAWA